MRVLITGGAGFIGQHLSRRLLSEGCHVTILDNFNPQIHGEVSCIASDLSRSVRVIEGDVRDLSSWEQALPNQEAVVHLAAETGTGQSMYEVARYEQTNISGTALLLDLLANRKASGVKRLIVASSRATYGEGAYLCPKDALVYPRARNSERSKQGEFEPRCPICQGACESTATPESAPFQPASFYGLTKQVQEQMVLMFGRVLGIPSFALRYQNVYGPGQSLKNPYTGILAVFSNLARKNQPIRIFEDGQESRDFVYIDDVVEATFEALTAPCEGSHAVNVGSGIRTTVLEVADQIKRFFESSSDIRITGEFREGDIRHGSAEMSEAGRLLGFKPRWAFADGLVRFLESAAATEADSSGYERSLLELQSRGLMHGK